MANLQETSTWEPGIYQLEETDPVQGGANGIDNKQAKQLANRTQYLKSGLGALHADMAEGMGRNLLTVLGVSTIQQAMAILHQRCNGNGTPDFSGIEIGDYIDGLSLSNPLAAPDGIATQTWNNAYKNNRIVISGFNVYNEFTYAPQNHILFTFRNNVCIGKMNFTNTNVLGYNKSDLRVWMSTINYDDDSAFSLKDILERALGGYLYPVSRLCSRKSSHIEMISSVFLPTEIEMFGYQTFGDELVRTNSNVQFPIYAKSNAYRIKKYNGVNITHWLQTPSIDNGTDFCAVNANGCVDKFNANSIIGISPAFCIS